MHAADVSKGQSRRQAARCFAVIEQSEPYSCNSATASLHVNVVTEPTHSASKPVSSSRLAGSGLSSNVDNQPPERETVG